MERKTRISKGIIAAVILLSLSVAAALAAAPAKRVPTVEDLMNLK